MTESTPDKPDKLGRCLNRAIGCVLFGCLVVCLAPFIFYGVMNLHYRWTWQHQQRDWDRLAIDDYRITVYDVGLSDIGKYLPARGMIEVCAGKITRVDDQPCELSMFPDSCGGDPIEGLFNAAKRDWWLFCWTYYDEQYHFPMKTGCGFIEGGWLEVTEFEVIDCAE